MNNLRISYLNISPYSRHSPSLQLRTELKKQSNSVERPKSSKISYAGATTRGNTPVNNPDSTDRKYSPFNDKKNDRKGEIMASLYQLAKSTKAKEKPNTANKVYRKDPSEKKTLKSSSRPSDKLTEKLAIYQYLQSKAAKKAEDSKSNNPSLQQTPSRSGSKSHFQEEKNNSQERKMLEASILQQKQLIEALEEMHRSKNKSSEYIQNQNNLALLLKSAQRPSQTSSRKTMQLINPVSNGVSLIKDSDDSKKNPEPKRNDFFKDVKLVKNLNNIQTSKEKPYISQQENEIIMQKKHHRRGLSMGQNPLSMEQLLYEQEKIREAEQERMLQQHYEEERMKQLEQERMQQLEQERIRQLQLQRHQQQQLQIQQQLQLQQQFQLQQQQYKDPQQEEDEYFEEFFHMDKMTFEFERLMVAQKMNRGKFLTPNSSPVQSKQSGHNRTRSIEEPNSLLPTKSTSRWTTKRSSMGDDKCYGQAHNNFNVIDQTSEFERTDNEREDMRRYFKV